ncbi:glycosyltransferase [Butyrivibrio sp. AD3002]|uniref:glycosyltransferase n=1 Tax=Butyrivibrio sp. AD3002 TaxID=1280670 RepID=UPI0003B4EE6F|nr:glycosyltransferase [Butyrivibrio sp. AD3002]
MNAKYKKSIDNNLCVLKPIDGNGNPYIDIIRQCINDAGYRLIEPKDALRPNYIFKQIKVSNFNWYENIERNTKVKTYRTIAVRKAMVIFLKYAKKSKIIITVHNKKNHNETNKDLSEKMLVWLINKADVVTILCDDTVGFLNGIVKKYGLVINNINIKKICLPNYYDVYVHSSKKIFSEIAGIRDKNCLELAYFGTISEYKNVGILLELADRIKDFRIHITIAGKGEQNYLEDIKSKIGMKRNITFYDKYVPDEKIWGFIEGADLVVLPYRKESILNSSAVLLALTVGTNVVCPEMGTTKEFPQGLIYTYDYNSDDEHLEKLYEVVIEAYNDYCHNKEKFEFRAKRINSLVLENNSKDIVAQKYKELYDELTI